MSFNKSPNTTAVGTTSPLGFVLSNRSLIIDASASTFGSHNANFYGTSAGTEIDYHFIDPISSKKKVYITSIRFKKDHTDEGRVAINGNEFIGNWADTGEEVYVDVPVNRRFASLNTLTLFLETQGTTTIESKLYRVQIFGYFNEEFEFNDSVLATKAYNSSRYDGKQLQASEVNLATTDDIGNNSRTPIIQNYSRNIYLGSRVISMGELAGAGSDDTSLVTFPGFSYITVHEFITVHDDLSVSRHTLVGDKPNTNHRFKKSWYQSFYDDFPIGSDISLRFFDEKLETSLDNSYKIFFNGGQLKKLLHVREIDTGSKATDRNFPAHYQTGSHIGRATSTQTGNVFNDAASQDPLTAGSGHVFFINDTNSHNHDFGASFTIFNKENIIDKFFEGSLVADPVAAGTGIVQEDVTK